jgi:hypothetical protein
MVIPAPGIDPGYSKLGLGDRAGKNLKGIQNS